MIMARLTCVTVTVRVNVPTSACRRRETRTLSLTIRTLSRHPPPFHHSHHPYNSLFFYHSRFITYFSQNLPTLEYLIVSGLSPRTPLLLSIPFFLLFRFKVFPLHMSVLAASRPARAADGILRDVVLLLLLLLLRRYRLHLKSLYKI